jgi:hypothetical protein
MKKVENSGSLRVAVSFDVEGPKVAEPGPSEGKPLNFLAKVRKRPIVAV